MQIVKFKNGLYGIRKGWFKPFYRYLDLDSNTRHYTRWRNKYYDLFVSNCMGNLDKVINIYKLMTDYGKKTGDFGELVDIIG